MHRFVIEFSYVDCVLVSVVMGFFVEVFRLGVSGICSSWICCPLRYSYYSYLSYYLSVVSVVCCQVEVFATS